MKVINETNGQKYIHICQSSKRNKSYLSVDWGVIIVLLLNTDYTFKPQSNLFAKNI